MSNIIAVGTCINRLKKNPKPTFSKPSSSAVKRGKGGGGEQIWEDT